MPTWSWWVPYAGMALGALISYVLTHRSDSFKELTEVKNSYKEKAMELTRVVNALTIKVDNLAEQNNRMAEQQRINSRTIQKLEKSTEDLVQRESDCKKQVSALMRILTNEDENRGHHGESSGPLS